MQLTAAHITCQTNMLVMSFLIIISFMNAYVIAVHILDVFTTLYTFYSKIYTCIFTIQQQPNQYSCLQVIQKDSGWNQPSVEQPFPQKLQKVLSSSKFLLCNWKMNIINSNKKPEKFQSFTIIFCTQPFHMKAIIRNLLSLLLIVDIKTKRDTKNISHQF